jgi:hypothetical protein
MGFKIDGCKIDGVEIETLNAYRAERLNRLNIGQKILRELLCLIGQYAISVQTWKYMKHIVRQDKGKHDPCMTRVDSASVSQNPSGKIPSDQLKPR